MSYHRYRDPPDAGIFSMAVPIGRFRDILRVTSPSTDCEGVKRGPCRQIAFGKAVSLVFQDLGFRQVSILGSSESRKTAIPH